MSYSQLRHWVKANVLGGQITNYHPDFVSKLNQVEKLSTDVQQLIKSMRDVVDPNLRWPFNPAKLANPELDESLRFAQHLRALGDACRNDQVKQYLQLVANVEEEINVAIKLFLRQVETYTFEPLNKFVKEDAVLVRQEKKNLDKMRADYDNACDYLRNSHEGNIDQKNANLDKCKENFEKQADLMQSLLDKLPEYEKTIADASKQFLKADRQLRASIGTALKKIKN
uniref:BAR domain-containing protein n=1 Tax=Trichuris muris TaxID=70415 RepID=A0A5S6QB65_TRIMR